MYARNTGDGSAMIPIRAYAIAAETNISMGQVVKLANGLVVAASAGDTSNVLGVAAENHTGTAAALNVRNNGTEILVYSGKNTIFATKAPIMAAAGGTETTVTMNGLGAFANGDFNGGYLVLVEKAEGSNNNDEVGTVKRIESYAYSGGTSTFTVAAGGAAAAGDKYAVYPPIGFAKGNYSADGTALVLTATAAIKMKVAGNVISAGEILMEKV